MAGLGICVLPEFAVQKELDHHALKHIDYSTDYDIATQLIYHKDKWLSSHLSDFISTVQNFYTLETAL